MTKIAKAGSLTANYLFCGSDSLISNKYRREHQLLVSDHYKQVFDQHHWVASRFFRACNKKNDLDSPRLGLAISKKISKLATTRNFLKRHIRESFRHNKEAMQTLDIVVLAKHESVNAKPKELRQDLKLLWKRCQNL